MTIWKELPITMESPAASCVVNISQMPYVKLGPTVVKLEGTMTFKKWPGGRSQGHCCRNDAFEGDCETYPSLPTA